jgi:hypothetical protein
MAALQATALTFVNAAQAEVKSAACKAAIPYRAVGKSLRGLTKRRSGLELVHQRKKAGSRPPSIA